MKARARLQRQAWSPLMLSLWAVEALEPLLLLEAGTLGHASPWRHRTPDQSHRGSQNWEEASNLWRYTGLPALPTMLCCDSTPHLCTHMFTCTYHTLTHAHGMCIAHVLISYTYHTHAYNLHTTHTYYTCITHITTHKKHRQKIYSTHQTHSHHTHIPHKHI